MNLLGSVGSLYMLILIFLLVIGFGLSGLALVRFMTQPNEIKKGKIQNNNYENNGGYRFMNSWLRLAMFSFVAILVSMAVLAFISPGGMTGANTMNSNMYYGNMPMNQATGGMNMPMNNMGSGGGMGMMNMGGMPMNQGSGGMGMMNMGGMSNMPMQTGTPMTTMPANNMQMTNANMMQMLNQMQMQLNQMQQQMQQMQQMPSSGGSMPSGGGGGMGMM